MENPEDIMNKFDKHIKLEEKELEKKRKEMKDSIQNR